MWSASVVGVWSVSEVWQVRRTLAQRGARMEPEVSTYYEFYQDSRWFRVITRNVYDDIYNEIYNYI